MTAVTVSALSVAPVKATRLHRVDAIELGAMGAVGDRRFSVIDERGRMVNGKSLGGLQTVLAECDPEGSELTLSFADGSAVSAPVEHNRTRTMRFYSEERAARELQGPWHDAISAQLERPLWIVEPEIAVDRGRRGGASLVGSASLGRLAEAAGNGSVDARRFRMLIEVDGLAAHAEDGWVGRRLRVGEALVAMHGHIGRCLITSRHPETGEVDLPTLDLLRGYRDDVDSTEPLPLGIYGEVLEPGSVGLGDAVTLAAG